MKIGFIAYHNPTDKRAASGTPFRIYKQLEKIGETTWIPIKKKGSWKFLRLPLYLYNKLPFIKKVDWEHTKYANLLKYKHIDNSILNDFDIIIANFCSSIITKKFNKPLIYLSDATFPAMVNYYEAYTNIPNFNIKQGFSIEKRAMELADKIILSSDWAKKSALKDLNIEEEKIKIIEFGANLEDNYITQETKNYHSNKFNILFLGVKWERKGGNIAVETVRWLNENNVKADLHIVGIKELPENLLKLPFIKYHGFLDKNNDQDYNKINTILKNSHILLLPTKAECSAIAFAEACMYGLPVFTHDTGGIGNYIINGLNGYKLSLGSTGKDFGKKIKKSLDNNECPYLSKKARELYLSKLNWDNWGKEMSTIIKQLVYNGKNI